MYEPHPLFEQPENETVNVWRYMDFTKLISLVDSQSLFFPRCDKLGDPYEGSWPRINVDARAQIPAEIVPEARPGWVKMINDRPEISKRLRKCAAINSWHMNDHESAAMWRLYLRSKEGIAVKSNYRNLRDSICDDEKFYLGAVKYIDYEKEWIDAGNIFSALIHKRKSFEHEREVRAVVIRGDEMAVDSRQSIQDGLKLKVNVEKLVEKIYVAPSAPNWFADLVRAVMKRYGHSFEVKQSNLDKEPLF
jgi:hypothetical protein